MFLKMSAVLAVVALVGQVSCGFYSHSVESVESNQSASSEELLVINQHLISRPGGPTPHNAPAIPQTGIIPPSRTEKFSNIALEMKPLINSVVGKEMIGITKVKEQNLLDGTNYYVRALFVGADGIRTKCSFRIVHKPQGVPDKEVVDPICL